MWAVVSFVVSCVFALIRVLVLRDAWPVLCGNNLKKDPTCLFHCFTNDPQQRERWLQLLEISEDQLTPHSRVCSRHFPAAKTHN